MEKKTDGDETFAVCSTIAICIAIVTAGLSCLCGIGSAMFGSSSMSMGHFFSNFLFGTAAKIAYFASLLLVAGGSIPVICNSISSFKKNICEKREAEKKQKIHRLEYTFERNILEAKLAKMSIEDKLNPARNREIIEQALIIGAVAELFKDKNMTWEQQYELYKQMKSELIKPENNQQKKTVQDIILKRQASERLS